MRAIRIIFSLAKSLFAVWAYAFISSIISPATQYFYLEALVYALYTVLLTYTIYTRKKSLLLLVIISVAVVAVLRFV